MIYDLKDCCKRYKKVLRRINKRRLKVEVDSYINECLEEETNDDLVMSEWITDANYQDYHMFEHNEWLKYLDKTWTLEDELEYCDRVMAELPLEYKMMNELEASCATNFTEEERNYYINSFRQAFNKEEIDPIKRAMNAYQAVKDYQDAWKKYGVEGLVELYFNITTEEQAEKALEEFCKDLD